MWLAGKASVQMGETAMQTVIGSRAVHAVITSTAVMGIRGCVGVVVMEKGQRERIWEEACGRLD